MTQAARWILILLRDYEWHDRVDLISAAGNEGRARKAIREIEATGRRFERRRNQHTGKYQYRMIEPPTEKPKGLFDG